MDSLSDERFFKIMNKLVDWKTKFEFVMRYINGESALKLGRELRSHWANPTQQIYFWWQLLKAGVSALKPKLHDQKTKHKRKRPIDWSKFLNSNN